METLRQRSGAAVLAVQKKTDEFLPNPPGSQVIQERDRLIVVGTGKGLAVLEATSGSCSTLNGKDTPRAVYMTLTLARQNARVRLGLSAGPDKQPLVQNLDVPWPSHL